MAAAPGTPHALPSGRLLRHEARSGADSVRPLLVLWLSILLCVTVLQRLALPGSGGVIGVGFAVAFALTVHAVIRGRLRLDPVRFALYAFMAATLLLTLFGRVERFSIDSLFMLLVLYLPFILMVEVTRDTFELMLEVFQRVMILSALAGLAQFAIQVVLGPDAMFPFDIVLPQSFFIQGFNLRIGVGEGLDLLKSTGLWFLEPSHFSQALAFAIVVELLHARRLAVLALFGAAYIVSFSGTGALLLLALALPLAVRLRWWWLLLLPAVFVPLTPFLADIPPFSLFLGRLDELNNPMASGSMRLFGPFWLVADVMLDHPRALFFGFGPGSVENVASALDYAVQDSSWLKLFVEYGLIGTTGFTLFYLHVLFRHAPDRLLAFACLFQFLFLGGYLNAFYIQFLYMALVAWPRIRSAAVDVPSRHALQA
ncbi:MAG: hypothetical protein R3C97_17695 [Geminicoccaceae bacterium]